MSQARTTRTTGRRPGEAPVAFLLSAILGSALRGRRAGGAHSVLTRLPAPETITVRSTAFAPGAPIPDAHAGPGRGGNRSPQLQWSTVPHGTRQLLLVIEDADVPLARPILHLAALVDPELTGFSEGELNAGPSAADGVRFIPAGRNGRRLGYRGPRALPRHGVHHYDFVLFALDHEIPASTPLPGVDAVVALAEGHVLARGRVTGTQEA